MNILLLNPPTLDNIKMIREGRCMQRQETWGTSWPPLSLATIGAILKNEGFTVSLYDCSNDGLNFKDLEKIIEDFKPDIIYVSTSTPSIVGDLTVATLAKKIDKKIKTAFFGVHVTALARETFEEYADVDLIVSGEPEYTILDLSKALRDGHHLSNIKGLIYRDKENVICNESRPYIENLDELPYPAWELVKIENYRLPIKKRPFLLVATTKGCPYPCTFCTANVYYGNKFRYRSSKSVVDEIVYTRERFKINDFMFWAENGISNNQYMVDICRGLIESAPGVRWVSNARVDMVNEKLLSFMKRAGCWMLSFGVESGSQAILDSMKKGISVEDIGKALHLTKRAGIETTCHVIIGYPGEKRSDILNTLKFLKIIDPDYIQIYCAVPFPGSELYDMSIKNYWIKKEPWASYEQNFSIINTELLTAEEVMKLRSILTRSFYLRPAKILKTLHKIKSINEFYSLLKLAKEFILNSLSWKSHF